MATDDGRSGADAPSGHSAKPEPISVVSAQGASVPNALDRDFRQWRVFKWASEAFGVGHARSIPQRGIRLAEEAIEAAQAAGCERAMLHHLVDYIFDRPAGALGQEIGGVGLTLLALAEAADESADAREAAELERVLSKPLSHFAARNQVKNDAGFDLTPASAGEAFGEDREDGLHAEHEHATEQSEVTPNRNPSPEGHSL